MPIPVAKIERQEDDIQLLVGALGALLPGILYLILPARVVVVQPAWLLLAAEALLVAPPTIARVVIGSPLSYALARGLALALLAVVTAALVGSVALLVSAVVTKTVHGTNLLQSAGLIWILNILVFALWYWEVDDGGPLRRLRKRTTPQTPDILFPQQARHDGPPWKPGFVDYVFLAFCFSTALSPADSMPLTRRAKLLMMAQALISALVLVLLVSRSVNII